MGMGTGDQAHLTSFRDIQEQFGRAIGAHTSRFTKHALRRLRISDNQSVSRHRCATYLKEEIILGASLTESAILTSLFPSIHEVCFVCGKRVEGEDDEVRLKSSKSCKFIIQPPLALLRNCSNLST
jgi:hypothetical protein